MRTIECPECHEQTKVNGVGTDSGKLASAMSKTVNFIYPVACKVFRTSADYHDWRYAIYKFGKKKADRLFLRDMLQAIKNRDNNWFTERWLKWQANKFYLAVKIGGGDAYEVAQKECLDNLIIKGLIQ